MEGASSCDAHRCFICGRGYYEVVAWKFGPTKPKIAGSKIEGAAIRYRCTQDGVKVTSDSLAWEYLQSTK